MEPRHGHCVLRGVSGDDAVVAADVGDVRGRGALRVVPGALLPPRTGLLLARR